MVAEQRVREKTASPRTQTAPGAEWKSGGTNAPRPRRAMAHVGHPILRHAKAIQEKTRVPGAVALAAFTVTILCLYLSAYASVTAEGFELSRFRAMNKQADLQRDILQAEISRLSLPQTVAQRAASLQMQPGTPESIIIISNGSGVPVSASKPLPITTSP